MNEDLKWLAENVSEWKFLDHDLIRYCKNSESAYYAKNCNEIIFNRREYYTKEQWQQARKELGYDKNLDDCTPEEWDAARRAVLEGGVSDPEEEECIKLAEERMVSTENDNVNHPQHYMSDTGIECIDAIRAALGREGFIAFCRGNAIKYQWRIKNNPAEDQAKAAWYANKAREAMLERSSESDKY